MPLEQNSTDTREDARIDVLKRRALSCFDSTERKNAETLWSQISEFVLPNQSGLFTGETSSSGNIFGSSTPGGKKTARLFDSTAIQANSDLASTMHSTLTNPATQWSKIRYKDEALNNNSEAVNWLQEVNRKIHDAINESNFDTEISKNYQMYTAIGSMALLHESVSGEGDADAGLLFTALHLSEVAWEENHRGEVDRLYRKFKLTGQQLMDKFPLLKEDIKLKAMEKPNDSFGVLHTIYPRAKKDIKINELGFAVGKHRPFASIYICLDGDGSLLEEDGYFEFPAHVVRFGTLPGERYGRGPGHIALPDIRTLNRLKELHLQAVNKAINPPLLAQRRDMLGTLDLRPGKISIVQDVNGIKEMPMNGRFDVSQMATEELKMSIKSIFYLDKLLLPPRTDTGEMTATEIQIRTEQMQRVLGPTLGRLNSELLSPLIERAFNILMRNGAFPQVPAIIKENGLDVDIIFLNSLARSQQFGDITNILGFAGEIAQLAQLDPNILVRFDGDAAIKHIAKVRGVPESVVRNDDEVAEIMQAQAEAQQNQTALDQDMQRADIHSKTAGAGNGQQQQPNV